VIGAANGAVGAIVGGSLHGLGADWGSYLTPAAELASNGTQVSAWGTAAHIAAHGAAGGAMSVANGGTFQDGFIGGLIGAGTAGVGIKLYGNTELYSGTAAWAVAGRTAISSVTGGLSAMATGGKFADGAYSAAFFHLFNAERSIFSTDWHHMIPFAEGLEAGLPFDFINSKSNGWIMRWGDHNALHSAGWLEEWKSYFATSSNPGSVREAYAHLGKLAQDPRFKPHLLKGHYPLKAYDLKKAIDRLNGLKAVKAGTLRVPGISKALPGALRILGAGIIVNTYKAEAAQFGHGEAAHRAFQRQGSLFGTTPSEQRQLERDTSDFFYGLLGH
jgi:hypothetical protein